MISDALKIKMQACCFPTAPLQPELEYANQVVTENPLYQNLEYANYTIHNQVVTENPLYNDNEQIISNV